MKTIKQVLEDFLTENKSRLKPRTSRGYEDTMELFEHSLNNYAYQSLEEEETKLFDKLYEEGEKEFCEIFGPEKITSGDISEFLNYFLISKVASSKELMKTVGRVMKIFVEWLNEKGYMNKEKYEEAAEMVDELKDELPKVEELSNLIYDYIQDSNPADFSETTEGYFKVTKIEPGKLWLEENGGPSKNIGPVIVSKQISNLCKVGWVINLELGKTKKGWRMLESGNVYPE